MELVADIIQHQALFPYKIDNTHPMTTVLEILENLGLDDDAIKEVQENLEKFDDLAECLESCEELTKKQVKILNEQLKLVFQKLKEGVDENTGGLIDEAEGNDEVDATELDLKLIPLIVIQHEMQETIMVEKYVLSVLGVEYLCNLVPESERGDIDIMYTAPSGAPAIDFKTLDKLAIECVGLFGPLKAVFKTLQEHFPKANLNEHEKYLTRKESGLYMLDIKNKKRKFLIFVSKNDSDFSLVKKESRAVHFLRYMSQLTNNVFMCLDDNYLDRLAKQDQSGEIRRAVYKIEKREIQPESFTIRPLGKISSNQIKSFTHFFSSGAGFLAAKCENISACKEKVTSDETHDLHTISLKIQSMAIESFEKVDVEFKKNYIRTFEPDAYQQLEAELNSKTEEFEKNILMHIKRQIIVANIEHLFEKTELSLSRRVAVKCLLNEENPHSKLVIKSLPIDQLISLEALARFRKQIKESRHEDKNAIRKYLLLKVSAKRDKLSGDVKRELISNYTWEELEKMEKKWYKVGSAASIETKLKEAEKELDYSHNVLHENVKVFIDFVIETFDCHSLEFRNFCVSKEKALKKQNRNQELNKSASDYFEKIVKTKCKPSDAPLIKQIGETEYSYETTQYSITVEKLSLVGPKTKTEMYRMSVTDKEVSQINNKDAVLNVDALNFSEVATFETCETEALVNAFPLDSNQVFLIINQKDSSKIMFYHRSNAREKTWERSFGRNVSLASYDSYKRILAMQSQSELGVVHSYRLEEPDFKAFHPFQTINLADMLDIQENVELCLQPKSDFFWFVNDRKLYKVDYKNRRFIKKISEIDGDWIKTTADGTCMLIGHKNQVLPVMTQSMNKLETKKSSEVFHIVSHCNSNIAVEYSDSELVFHQITVTGSHHETKLSKQRPEKFGTEKMKNESLDSQEHWVNYIYWMYTKFPCDDLLTDQKTFSHFWILFYGRCADNLPELRHEIDLIQEKIQETLKPIESLKIHQVFLKDPNQLLMQIQVMGK